MEIITTNKRGMEQATSQVGNYQSGWYFQVAKYVQKENFISDPSVRLLNSPKITIGNL